MSAQSTLSPAATATLPALNTWAEDINLLAAHVVADTPSTLALAGKRRRRSSLSLLSTADDNGANTNSSRGGAHPFGYRMAHDVAEHLVQAGMDPDYLGEFATLSGLDARDVLDFTGIDRTTVSRRKASGATLPQDTAVKALQVTDLVTQATEVFGTPALASAWLTKPHPLLDDQTPLRRARTPWGLIKVQGLLVALRYGGAA
jgi:putative toxin-antitoxin system antitoxin component (TIGR02293 family)